MTAPSPESVAAMRRDYHFPPLRRADLAASPASQFARWFKEARASDVPEPNAFVLATIGLDGMPNARTVLMKGFGEEGLTFFTNYQSQKGRELEAHPLAAASFLWKELARQVQVRGRIEKTTREESRDYFSARPYESRIGAWASCQSDVIPDRNWLEQRAESFRKKYPDTGSPDAVPLPDFWGGYRLVPESVEFWQGQPGRLHDRLIYRKNGGQWDLVRLSP